MAGRLPVFCEGGYLPGTVGGDGAVVPGEGIEGSMPLEASALNARYELDSELYLQGDVRLRQGPFQATGAEARYNQQSGELQLQGPLVSEVKAFC